MELSRTWEVVVRILPLTVGGGGSRNAFSAAAAGGS